MRRPCASFWFGSSERFSHGVSFGAHWMQSNPGIPGCAVHFHLMFCVMRCHAKNAILLQHACRSIYFMFLCMILTTHQIATVFFIYPDPIWFNSLIPAVTLVSALGVLSGYTFGLYGRLVHQTQAKTLGEIWERQKSKSTAWVVSLSSLLFCFGASLSYTIMLGDVAESFTQLAGVSGGIFASRSLWVSILAVTTLRPLCNLSSLAALAPMSLVGVFAILFTSAFVGFRCPAINPASPYSLAAGGGALLSSLTSSQMPLFNTFTKGILHPASLILGGMAATAFLGHFSAPDFYHTLKEDNEKKQHAAAAVAAGSDESSAASTVDDTKSKSIADFLKVTTGGFSAIIGINAVLLTLGFLTFGGNSMGILLNNYSSLDPFATFCRLIMAVNVIGGFPFVFRGCRSEVMSLLKKSDVKTERKVTNVMMSLLVGCSMLMKNAGLVIGFNGAVMGSAIVYIFPALLFLSQTGKLSQLTRSQKMERWLCRFLVAFGGVAVVAGGAVSIINGLFPHLLA